MWTASGSVLIWYRAKILAGSLPWPKSVLRMRLGIGLNKNPLGRLLPVKSLLLNTLIVSYVESIFCDAFVR